MIEEKLLSYFAKPSITKVVYAGSAILVWIFGLIFGLSTLLLLVTTTENKVARKHTSTNVLQNVELITKKEIIKACTIDSFRIITCMSPRIASKTVLEPYFELNFTYPPEIYEGDTGEISLKAQQRSNLQLSTPNHSGIVQIKLLSGKGLSFVRDKINVAIGDVNPKLVHFESKEVAKKADKKVLVQGRLLPISNSKDIVKEDGTAFSDLGSFDIRVLPKEVIFGLTESTLKGIQMLFGALGIPALLLFGVTLFANKFAPKKNESNKSSPQIILPIEDHRIPRKSSGRKKTRR